MLRLPRHQIKPASEILAQAFLDDPLWTYFIPDISRRQMLLRYIFELRVRFGISHGEVYATSSNLEGVAVWLRSEKTDMNLIEGIRHGGMQVLFRLGMKPISRMLSAGRFVYEIQRRYAPPHSWYLSPIGVAPQFQGKGYASRLLGPMFARFDKEKLLCFLETQKKENVPVYLHYGFKLVDETVIPGTGVSNWAMIREPREPG